MSFSRLSRCKSFEPIRCRLQRLSFLDTCGGASSSPFSAGQPVTWPHAARAQRLAMPVIGFLGIRSPAELTHLVDAFRRGLKEIGYIEGENVEIEYRWAENNYGRLPALATELS